MPNPKKRVKLSLRERIKRARQKVALKRKDYGYPDAGVMHERIANAHLAYGANLTMEALVFLGGVKETLEQKAPLTPTDIDKLKSLWDHFVKPLQGSGAS